MSFLINFLPLEIIYLKRKRNYLSPYKKEGFRIKYEAKLQYKAKEKTKYYF